MPARIVLRLTPGTRTAGPPTPRQLHGCASTLLGETDVEHVASEKPWSAVLETRSSDLDLIIGWLNPQAPPQLQAERIRFGPAWYRVHHVDRCQWTFPDLATGASSDVGLEMLTPTWLMRGGVAFPFPDPLLIYARLAERWNAHAPLPLRLPEALRKELLDSLVLRSWSGDSTPFDIGQGLRQGFTGRMVAGVSPNADDTVKQALAALTRFAELSGVGAQTTFGAGHVQVFLT